jgi:hypothetical protein
MGGMPPEVTNKCSSELASQDDRDGIPDLTCHRVQAALECEAARECLEGCGLANANRTILDGVAEPPV